MRGTWIASIGLLAALCAAPALAQSPPGLIELAFKADVQADGVPTNIQPDAALAAPLQAMVRKRVAGWRYRMGSWQGQPVPASVSQKITAEVVPVTSGGFALRIRDVSLTVVRVDRDDTPGGARTPPAYPGQLMRQGIGGELVYAYRIDAAGKPQDIELVHPRTLDYATRLLDGEGRKALARWTLPPTKVGNEPVDCRVLTPMSFTVTESFSGHAALSSADVRAYRESHPDLCPSAPVLITEVQGSIL